MTRNDQHKSLRSDAVRFFEWSRFSIRELVEKLDASDKKEFQSGTIPPRLIDKVRSAWSNHLKNGWPPEGPLAVVAKVLKNPEDLETWKHHPYGQTHTLPKRIRTAVFAALKERGEEINAAFFDNDGEARLANYLQVWQGRRRAQERQTVRALGWTCKRGGGSRFGAIEIDMERRMLSEAEASGSAMNVTNLLPFLSRFWEMRKAVFVKTDTGIDCRIVPAPGMSELRLNRFLVRLGRALASKKKRRTLPDWLHGVDQTERFIVEGWCGGIIVDGETWPPLCMFSTPALVRFLRLCNFKHCKGERRVARSIEKAIQRLGLVRIPKGRIRHVEKRGGRFYFA